MQKESKKTEDAKNVDLILFSKSDKEKQLAFNALYSKYKKNLTIYISIRVGGDSELTQDLVQDTFQRVHANIDKYDEERGAFSTWIYNVAKNLVIDFFRKQKHEILSIDSLTGKMTDENDNGGLEFQIDGNFDTPEDIFIKKERAKLVRKAVDSLKDENKKEIMKMRFFEELSVAEINKILGLKRNHSTTRVLILKSKKILAKELKGKVS